MSITFGDQAENHVGMQVLGAAAACGFTIDDLRAARLTFDQLGYVTELVDLHAGVEGAEPAAVLVIRGGAAALLGELGEESDGGGVVDGLADEQLALDVDTKAFMRGRIVNKRARYNLCYAEESQEPDYAHKRGRIVAFREVPHLDRVRDFLPHFLGPKADGLVAELNLYHDVRSCGIGFHGDTERRIVVCVRLGETLPLHYQWFHRGAPVGDPICFSFDHGDVYVMSEKAVGFDWRQSSRLTLRHAAGCEKYLRVKTTAKKAPAKTTAKKTKAKTKAKTTVPHRRRDSGLHQWLRGSYNNSDSGSGGAAAAAAAAATTTM